MAYVPTAAHPGTRVRRVVFVNRFFHPDESATSRMLSDLVFRLAGQGLSVAVVTSRQLYENPEADLAAHEFIRGVQVWRVASARRGRGTLIGRTLDYLTFHLSAARVLAAVLQPGDVVVAKTDPPLISVLVSWVARWRGADLINWLQDVFPEVLVALAPRALPRAVRRVLVAARDRSLRRAAMNIAIGDRMAAHLLQHGVEPDHVRVIPNWADCEAIRPMSSCHSATRARFGLEDRFVVGYSGNFGRAHEFHTLIAAARILAHDPQIAFLMTGGGARNAQLQEAVESLSLCSFHFQGYQPAELLSDSMAAADLHLVSLVPAVEGLVVPSKLYGILAAGRPVLFIGDTQGEVASLLRKHDCGLAVAVGDGARLAKLLRTLQNDPERCAVMGANARRLALSRFTADRAASDWFEMLALLSAAPRAAVSQ